MTTKTKELYHIYFNNHIDICMLAVSTLVIGGREKNASGFLFFFFVFGRLSKLNGKFLSDRYSDAHQTRTYRICGTTNFLFSSGIPKNLPVQARTAPVRMSSDLHTKSTKQARIRIRTRAHDSPIHTHSQTHIATD